ncbi:MAG: YjbQ family protein [Tissierellia bacterium]|nr:YjbQ family protein [Tissierellia bacterium]
MEYGVKTTKTQEFIDITNLINEEIKRQNVQEGIAVVFVPHTTAAVTINENTDPDVTIDIIGALNKVFLVEGDYRHYEGNSHAHIKASLMGSSCTLIIEKGKLKLGTWQGVYFCEFDGPRNRKVYIKVMDTGK